MTRVRVDMRPAAVIITAVLASTGPAVAGDAPTQPDTAALRAALVKQRATNLKRFEEYRQKRVYPHNTYQPGMLNVWKDQDGHLCAIATLVHDSGRDDLVDAIASDQNFVKLADVTSGPIADWILTSGLTQEEAVMIQQPSEADVEWMEAEQARQERILKRKLAREDRRLNKSYVAVERALEEPRIADAGLDVAVARLAARPELAAALLAGQP
jgi:hypothetical protein